MHATKEDLWSRLESFPLDDPAVSLPFSVRLAREQGWTQRYAFRVIQEYKRYLFLVATAEGPLCPSEDVDQAWHLHLCYTRSYWEHLCRQVLGAKLHHEPTRGGREQLGKHFAMYEHTLAAYRDAFQQWPPSDIWPPAEVRFKAGGRIRSVDVSDYWIIKKPRLHRQERPVNEARHSARTVQALSLLAAIPLIGVNLDVLEMRGPAFLMLYAVVLLVAAAIAWLLRNRQRAADDGAPLPELDAYEVAVLAGGEELATRVAISRLVMDGKVVADSSGLQSIASPADTQDGHEDHPLVHAIHKFIQAQPSSSASEVRTAGEAAAAPIGAKLEDAGLLETPNSFHRARWAAMKVMLPALALGIFKAVLGASRGRPIGFLAVLLAIAVVLTVMFYRLPRRTKRGDRLLRTLKSDLPKLNPDDGLQGGDEHRQLLNLALFGMGALAVAQGPLQDLHAWYRKQGSVGSGCSSGCGGDGGGCSGGGCGGCGGCGGD